MSRPSLGRASLASYVSGFVLSLLLTVLAYSTVQRHSFGGNPLTVMLLALAILQVVVQLFFFLHIGSETRPRWKLLTLFLMLVFGMIVIFGSIWIMYSLNYRMTPHQINTYMTDQASSGY
ncbi:MAG: cytochrome o ubiquinol oxidase subunit IV [Candidatus Saccharimonadales bacterium]